MCFKNPVDLCLFQYIPDLTIADSSCSKIAKTTKFDMLFIFLRPKIVAFSYKNQNAKMRSFFLLLLCINGTSCSLHHIQISSWNLFRFEFEFLFSSVIGIIVVFFLNSEKISQPVPFLIKTSDKHPIENVWLLWP